MMRVLAMVVGAALMLSQATGCAAILAPKTTAVRFASMPSGADVYVDGARVGSTPAVTQLSNSMPHVATIKKAGYKESSCHFGQTVGAGWVVLDFVMGVWPIVIDAATGSWYGISPSSCSVRLDPKGGNAAARHQKPAGVAYSASSCAALRTALNAEAGKPRAAQIRADLAAHCGAR